MARSGVCCASLEEPKALMKMGLSVILIGHVNFLLAALVHGVVLRHINLHKQARAMEYAISNVVAFTSGLVGVIVGILAIIVSKNKRRRDLMWGFFTVSLASALMAAASAVGLTVSVVRAIMYGGRSLLTHCRFPDAIGYSSVTNECPFDPTRIYSTTLILWVPLIVTCVVQLVFSSRCFAACVSFLGLSCCRTRTRRRNRSTAINVESPAVTDTLPSQTRLLRSHDDARRTEHHRRHDDPPARRTEHHRRHDDPPARRTEHHRSHKEPLRIYTEPPRRVTAPPRHQQRPPPLPPPLLPSHHHSLPSSNRKPVRQPAGESSSRERQQSGSGSRQRPAEQHQLLQRGAAERSSVWI